MNIDSEFNKLNILLVKTGCSIFLLLLMGTAKQVEAQNNMGARGIGMAGAVTALPDYEWSVFQNPVMMPVKDSHISFFAIRYYGISELTDSALTGVHSFSFGTMGVGLHSYGFDLYRENQFRLAFMKPFENFRLGAVLQYQHVAIERYGSAGALALNVGFAVELADDLWLGARASNLNRGSLGEANEELAREMAVGVSYLLAERILFATDLVKDVGFPFSYRSGVEVDVYDDFLHLRGGVSTEPLTFSLGLGFSRSFWSANFAAQHHEWLGWSPGVDFKSTW
ncbi:MAG: hypothetical protein WEB89_10105 [Balneolales bacterium]